MSEEKKSNPLSIESAMRTTLLTICVIVSIGFAYNYLDLGIFGGPVIIRAEVPDPIGIDKEEPFVPMDVKLYLENNTREPLRLTVNNPCLIMEWAVFREDGVFVQAMKTEDACAQMIMSASLDSGEATEETLSILLDPARYEFDETYMVLMRFWGHEVKKSFTVVKTN